MPKTNNTDAAKTNDAAKIKVQADADWFDAAWGRENARALKLIADDNAAMQAGRIRMCRLQFRT